MAGEDTTSSVLEAPALKPLAPESLSKEQLQSLASRIIDATWKAGLPQWSWGEGVYLLSEVRYYESQGLPVPQIFIDWFSQRDAITSGHINNVAPGAAASRIHALGLFDATKINKALENWVNDPKSATRAPNGAVEHWPGGVWADTCYMMGTFMLNHGVATQNAPMVEFIGDQLVKHLELLRNPETHLYAHGSHRGETLWNYWGRGNAWMALSCVEFLDACEAIGIAPATIAPIKAALKSQLEALIPLLPEYGIWDVLVDHQVENAGILETSATAGIGSAMIRAARYFPEFAEELTSVGRRTSAAALTYIDASGVLTRTSAGTVLQLIPFGYSVIRSDRMQLWGQGLALSAITALLSPEKNILAFNK
jgi:unsaturated rhamnogalacturonyl hydrolase